MEAPGHVPSVLSRKSGTVADCCCSMKLVLRDHFAFAGSWC